MDEKLELRGYTDEELKVLNNSIKGGRVKKLKDYPKNGEHLEVVLGMNVGMDILWNSDRFVILYEEKEGSRPNGILNSYNKWVVVSRSGEYFKYNKEFESVQDAIDYAYTTYSSHLDTEYKRQKEKVSFFLEEIGK